jgi:hypothetical protein
MMWLHEIAGLTTSSRFRSRRIRLILMAECSRSKQPMKGEIELEAGNHFGSDEDAGDDGNEAKDLGRG